jgi:hypothetical protein
MCAFSSNVLVLFCLIRRYWSIPYRSISLRYNWYRRPNSFHQVRYKVWTRLLIQILSVNIWGVVSNTTVFIELLQVSVSLLSETTRIIIDVLGHPTELRVLIKIESLVVVLRHHSVHSAWRILIDTRSYSADGSKLTHLIIRVEIWCIDFLLELHGLKKLWLIILISFELLIDLLRWRSLVFIFFLWFIILKSRRRVVHTSNHCSIWRCTNNHSVLMSKIDVAYGLL